VAANTRFINPETLSKPPSYTHVVEISGPGRTVHIAGQLGTDREGNVVGAPRDFRAQAVQVFENLKAALASVGADFADVVKLNSYLADIAHLPILRDVRAGYLAAGALPASTTLGGLQFARPGALLEIEAVAVLPPKTMRAQGTPAKAGSARRGAGAKRLSVRRKRK
jgi:enamine deaminase RidA (YjgF/YER057c/UK114 family)